MKTADAGEALLEAVVDDPVAAFVLADYLEEQGQADRAELLRLSYTLRDLPAADPGRPAAEARLHALLAAGVRPCVPTWTNPVGMTFAWVPPGRYLLGSPPAEEQRWDNEARHPVVVETGFYMSVTPVTQDHWESVRRKNLSHFQGPDLPVERVTWDECREFCRRLGYRDGLPYRLPTEAEWEYACRAGTTSPFHFGATISTDQANYDGAYVYGSGTTGLGRGCTTPVGQFPPNAWGLLDTHGNVWEWCSDRYAEHPADDGPVPGDYRVLRGGSWCDDPAACRSAARYWYDARLRRDFIGFRVCFGAG